MNTPINYETLKEIFMTSKNHINCAAGLMKDLSSHGEPPLNSTLFHLAMMVQNMLPIVCIKFKIPYAEDDSIEGLFRKTESFLPAHILAMEKDLCYWRNDVQNKSKNVMPAYEVYAIGHTLERFFNKYAVVYAKEISYDIDTSALFSVNIAELNKF